MMTLIIGGSGSGKSAYAEKIAVSSTECKKYYLATMQVFEEEGRKKVAEHRKSRRNKGFFTIEQTVDISGALKKMEAGERLILLECISNLIANEMFLKEKTHIPQMVEKVVKEIQKLKEETRHFIVVSNNIFEDGIIYDEASMTYLDAMGKINQELACLAEHVIEVVVGIPIVIK